MSSKGKLWKFEENETFSCLVQPSTDEVFGRDYRLKGRWKSDFFRNDKPIVLELGCGKGEYTIGLSSKFPDKNFIGVDIKGARLWRGAKYAEENSLPNVGFLRTRIEFLGAVFAPDEISEIWITFADPQAKKAKKRLTHSLFLNRYRNFLKENGIIHLKTDSRLLHEYTKALVEHNNLKIIESNSDIYGTGRADELLSIKTFYEKQFLAQGIPITYLAFNLDHNTTLSEPNWDPTNLI